MYSTLYYINLQGSLCYNKKLNNYYFYKHTSTINRNIFYSMYGKNKKFGAV